MENNNEYMVYFDFTTVKGNKFTGRSGQVEITTEAPLEELDKEDAGLIRVCANFVHSQKPKYNIFMLDIKNIEPIKAKDYGRK